MTEEKKKEFSMRIAQCTKTELVVITEEIIICYIQDAKKRFEEGDIEGFRSEIKKAQQFVDQLSSALDMRFPISYELLSLYNYIRKCFMLASVRKETVRLDEAEKIVDELRKAFEDVAKKDTSGSVMENSQKVYAGLTYGPGSNLNEIVF